jgi:hypothetical protein
LELTKELTEEFLQKEFLQKEFLQKEFLQKESVQYLKANPKTNPHHQNYHLPPTRTATATDRTTVVRTDERGTTNTLP